MTRPMITIDLSPNVVPRLDLEAKRRNISFSELVRRALDWFMMEVEA
jgi:hypothetical protein